MSLVGRGLDGAVKDAGGRLSLGSAVGVATQMLRALRGMHTIGYLHRDIKPGNACLGRKESNEESLLYMIDFGMARKYLKDDVSCPTCFSRVFKFDFLRFRGLTTDPEQLPPSEDRRATPPSPHTSDASTAARTTSNRGSTS